MKIFVMSDVAHYPSGRWIVPLLLILLLAGYGITDSLAAIYKWTDENGKVYYSDKPPPAGQAEELEVDSEPSAATRGLSDEQRRQKQQRLLDAFAKERADKASAQDKADKEAEELNIWCARAKDELRQLNEATYLYNYDETGEKVIFSDEAREQATRDQEKKISKYC